MFDMRLDPLGQSFRRSLLATALLAGCLVLGCSTLNDTRGQPVREVDPSRPGLKVGTGPESQDVLVVGDKMMRSLLSAPVIANAAAPPRIVLLRLDNQSRFPINAEIFLAKLRVNLNSKAAGKMIFLGRERMADIQAERELKRDGAVSADPAKLQEKVRGAEYFLTGKIQGLSKAGPRGQEDYLLYTFMLTDTESSDILWEDEFEMKRMGQDDVVYR